MPIIENVTTTKSEQIWESPDGQRKIYALTLEFKGQQFKAKTYSNMIASEGWAGDVETYEKPTKQGSDTFVKQPQKEQSSWQQAKPQTAKYQPKDEKAIQAMWSIGQAVLLNQDSKALGDEKLGLVESAAQELFAMVDRVKASESAPEAPEEEVPVQAKKEPETLPMPLDDLTPVSDEDLKKIDEIFGKKE